MSDFQFLRTSIEDGVGILQLHHPEVRNALGWELHEEIIEALRLWENDDDVSCSIARPFMPRGCSGGSMCGPARCPLTWPPLSKEAAETQAGLAQTRHRAVLANSKADALPTRDPGD